jgi:transketolase
MATESVPIISAAQPARHSPEVLRAIAAQLRIDSVRATTAARSGHPTSCASCAEIVAVLFFEVMRHDSTASRDPNNDVFVLSKGHAAPILYSAWAEAGAIPREQLLTLRQIDSDLEGHPTPRFPSVDVATGSLGQGLSAAIGLALDALLLGNGRRTYVLLGDAESAEGAVWEAAAVASKYRLGGLCATIDVNRLGQSQPTMLEYDMDTYRRRWEAFGWQALTVDGHDVQALLAAYETASVTPERPTVVLARTVKGKGLPGIEGAENEHGKALDDEHAERAVAALELELHGHSGPWTLRPPSLAWSIESIDRTRRGRSTPRYTVGGKPVAPRKAFGEALAALASSWPEIVVIDGDVKNSTFTELFQKAAPERFFEGYIAEQNMVGMAMGLAARGRIPFVSTFGAFFTRAYDFIRMACIGGNAIKLAGTHVGISIGEDGPSQMGLEDLAMMCAQPGMTVLYPADATSAWRATELVAQRAGPCYLRLGRPDAAILYDAEEEFAVGRCKVLRQTSEDRVLVVAAGVTVAEALAAHDELARLGIRIRVIDLFSVQPIDEQMLIESTRACNGVVLTVEDHYPHGGIGDAVLAALAGEPCIVHKLAVGEVPRSGKPKELLDRFGISAARIVAAVKSAFERSSSISTHSGFDRAPPSR